MSTPPTPATATATAATTATAAAATPRPPLARSSGYLPDDEISSSHLPTCIAPNRPCAAVPACRNASCRSCVPPSTPCNGSCPGSLVHCAAVDRCLSNNHDCPADHDSGYKMGHSVTTSGEEEKEAESSHQLLGEIAIVAAVAAAVVLTAGAMFAALRWRLRRSPPSPPPPPSGERVGYRLTVERLAEAEANEYYGQDREEDEEDDVETVESNCYYGKAEDGDDGRTFDLDITMKNEYSGE